MYELFCKINPFVLKQQIYKVDTETQEKTLLDQCFFGDLEDTLIALANQEQIFNFHFFGDKKFIEEIGNNIDTTFQLNYTANRINIYYN